MAEGRPWPPCWTQMGNENGGQIRDGFLELVALRKWLRIRQLKTKALEPRLGLPPQKLQASPLPSLWVLLFVTRWASDCATALSALRFYDFDSRVRCLPGLDP